MEKVIVHNIMATPHPDGENYTTHNIEFLAMNVYNFSKADLSTTKDTIQIEAPLVNKLLSDI